MRTKRAPTRGACLPMATLGSPRFDHEMPSHWNGSWRKKATVSPGFRAHHGEVMACIRLPGMATRRMCRCHDTNTSQCARARSATRPDNQKRRAPDQTPDCPTGGGSRLARATAPNARGPVAAALVDSIRDGVQPRPVGRYSCGDGRTLLTDSSSAPHRTADRVRPAGWKRATGLALRQAQGEALVVSLSKYAGRGPRDSLR